MILMALPLIALPGALSALTGAVTTVLSSFRPALKATMCGVNLVAFVLFAFVILRG